MERERGRQMTATTVGKYYTFSNAKPHTFDGFVKITNNRVMMDTFYEQHAEIGRYLRKLITISVYLETIYVHNDA